MSDRPKVVDTRRFTVDSLDQVQWRQGDSPFDHWSAQMNEWQAKDVDVAQDVDREVNVLLPKASVVLFRDLEGARAIAATLFGKDWPEFVMDVYDRLQLAKNNVDLAEDAAAPAAPPRRRRPAVASPPRDGFPSAPPAPGGE